MMVHRVGKTLMIDGCDTKRLIRKHDVCLRFARIALLFQDDLSNVRRFVAEQMRSVRGVNVEPTSHINEKLMHSKFIYHSLDMRAITVSIR